jgi:glucosamine-6-phosphate deaminase
MSEFKYKAAKCVPFQDKEVIERIRNIKREDIEKHDNPNYKIKVYPDHKVGIVWIADMFHRIFEAGRDEKKIVIITPNPCPIYEQVVYMINKFKIDCKHVYTFNMDEYADEDGKIAPETWEYGFAHAFKKYFYNKIDKELRPPEAQCVGFTDQNIDSYGKMVEDMGGADICYCGPGWTGHLAFIEPDAPEFKAPLKEWKKMGPRLVTLSPFTLAQNSLHGSFGMSGDLSMVPPMAATIGPAEIIAAKNRVQTHSISVHGTQTSWQRLISRLVMHGPVTPLVPESICQTLRTDVVVSETAAMDIKPYWQKGY